MKNKKTNLGVSDVIGTILLLGMAVALFSVLSAVVLSYPFQPSTPTVNILGFVDGNDIILEHRGGENLGLDTKISVMINNSDSYLFIVGNGAVLDDDFKSDGFWNIGENVVINATNDLPDIDLLSSRVDVTVIDVISNSVVMMGTLNEGKIITPASPPSFEPLIDNPYPGDDADNVGLNPVLSVDVEDLQGDTIYVKFMTNESGSWQQIGVTQSGDNDTYTQTTSGIFDEYDTEYWWSVNVSDSFYWTNKTYHFTTGSESVSLATEINPISPYELTDPVYTLTATGDTRLDDVTLWYRWSSDNVHWTDGYEPITIDAVSSTELEFYYSQVEWTHTVEDHDNRILVVVSSVEEYEYGDYGIDSITYNGVSLTKAASEVVESNGIIASSEIWYLLNPDIGAHTITVSYGSDPLRYIAVSAISFYNVAQQPPEVTNTNTAKSTSTISTGVTTSSDGSIIIDNVACGDNRKFTPGTGQTEFYEERSNGPDAAGAGSYKILSTAGSTSMIQTASSNVNRMAHVCVAFAPVSYHGIDWTEWSDPNNPDTGSPWNWIYDFSEGKGYYEFYSIGRYGLNTETPPVIADTSCYYNPG